MSVSRRAISIPRCSGVVNRNRHHTIPPANSTPTLTRPLLLPSCLLDHAPFTSSLFLLLFVLLSIEVNPGPSAFTLCTLNICSILHPIHSAALSDVIDTHNPDLFCLTETWIRPTTTSTELLNCTPPHYSLISTLQWLQQDLVLWQWHSFSHPRTIHTATHLCSRIFHRLTLSGGYTL